MTEHPPHPAERENQRLWDEMAPVHFRAYEEVRMLRDGREVLDAVELREIGDVHGKRLLHLQCHIGTDTLAWARHGAIVTGVDFSSESLALARALQQELGLEATFVHSNLYALRSHLEGSFDIVYASRGVLCWLRDLQAWARLIAHYLEPGGFFYLLESHPIVNIWDDTKAGALTVAHSYFHDPEPRCWDDDAPDYADRTYVPQLPSYEWTWSVGDILNALIESGLVIEHFSEYDRLFYKALPDMVRCSERAYHLPAHAGKLPWIFTLRARRH
ncbi:MAG: class I SAM-dependent methyltransferase [Candidatus Eiseniibacteriota bacterium]|jgi:SAM-dependent methyltransferase